MARFKNSDWDLADSHGNVGTWERVGIAVLMDIRDELQTLNRLLGCRNFIEVPTILREIKANTAPRPKVKKERAIATTIEIQKVWAK